MAGKWEVYGRKSGNIVRSSYSSNGNVEDEFLFENPVDHNQKNYKRWTKSLAEIEKEVEYIVNPVDPTTYGQKESRYTAQPETPEQIISRVTQEVTGGKELPITGAVSTDPFSQSGKDAPISLDPISEVKKAIETIASIPEVVKQAPAELQKIMQTLVPEPPTYIGPPSEVEDLERTAGPYQPPSADQLLKAEVPIASYIFDKAGGDLEKAAKFVASLYPSWITGRDDADKAKKLLDKFFDMDIAGRSEWLGNMGKDEKLFQQLLDMKTDDPWGEDWAGSHGQFLVALQEALDWKPPAIGIGGDGGTGRKPVYPPIEDLGWSESYKGFTNNMGISSPGAYGHVIEQGLSNNPLLRTAQTQFLAQSDYDVSTKDEELKNLHLANVQRGFVPETTGNPYLSFLETYVPLQGQDLINTIDSIITDINAPPGTIDESESKRLMRQMRFGISNQASQTQQQLVALPILEHASPALRKEMAGVLSGLHENWMMSPDRQKGDNWLQYARDKNFFGMVPEHLLGK